MFLVPENEIETNSQVFFLKEQRKNSLKIFFPHAKVFLRLKPNYYSAIVLPKEHIVHC